MISQIKLQEICKKYNLKYEKIVAKNENILNYGEEKDICERIEYLKSELEIESKNIEKCPSSLYFSTLKNIKNNWEYLKERKIEELNVRSCLHILASESTELKKIYTYIEENYGISYLNENTSILKVDINRIKEIESTFVNLNKKQIVQASISDFDINGLKK